MEESITFQDNRQEWEKDQEKLKEGLQTCKDVKATIRMNKEAIVKIAKERGQKFTCPYCKQDATFNYNLEEMDKHDKICKAKHNNTKLNKEEIPL